MKRCPQCGYREPSITAVRRKLGTQSARRKGQGCRIGDRDEAEKARRGYVEAGSFVRRDGSEKLVGGDWTQRKCQLMDRARLRCERESILGKPHADGCNGRGEDPHHIAKRWPRRDDSLENLAYLSRACHMAEDPRRVRSGKLGA